MYVYFCEKLMCLEIVIHQQILCHAEQHSVCAWNNQAGYVFEVCWTNVATVLNWAFIFEWYMASLVVKNRF